MFIIIILFFFAYMTFQYKDNIRTLSANIKLICHFPRNRKVKLTRGSFIFLFLKRVQINLDLWTMYLHIYYIYKHTNKRDVFDIASRSPSPPPSTCTICIFQLMASSWNDSVKKVRSDWIY
jgi:hypothetical protein